MNRRKFLIGSLAAGAALTVLPSRLLAGTRKNSALQLARIGCGRMGRGDMTNLLGSGWKSDFNARVVACCDVDANAHLRIPMREPFVL
jgi:hypothetical protein